jgi:hypothetical protein
MSASSMLDESDAFRTRENSVVSLFVHEDLGVVVHDARTSDADVLRLVAVEIPFVVFLRNEESEEGPGVNTARSVMSDFVGRCFVQLFQFRWRFVGDNLSVTICR